MIISWYSRYLTAYQEPVTVIINDAQPQLSHANLDHVVLAPYAGRIYEIFWLPPTLLSHHPSTINIISPLPQSAIALTIQLGKLDYEEYSTFRIHDICQKNHFSHITHSHKATKGSWLILRNPWLLRGIDYRCLDCRCFDRRGLDCRNTRTPLRWNCPYSNAITLAELLCHFGKI